MADDVQFNITLPEDLARLVRDKIESGEYADVNDVIVDGLRGLQEQNLPLEAWLRDEVVPAYDAMQADPARGLTLESVVPRRDGQQAILDLLAAATSKRVGIAIAAAVIAEIGPPRPLVALFVGRTVLLAGVHLRRRTRASAEQNRGQQDQTAFHFQGSGGIPGPF